MMPRTCLLLLLLTCSAVLPADELTLRVASFNVSLNRPESGQLLRDLNHGDAQARKVAMILRLARPDIVVLNEFDYDGSPEALACFQRNYLEAELANDAAWKDARPLELPHTWIDTVNTGQPSGLDLDRDGKTDGPADAFGYGRFPGQYGMAVLSRFPIDRGRIQTFRKLLWKNFPSALRPTDPKTGEPWYPEESWKQLRLSSKSHWVVPVQIQNREVNIVAAHPTPPAFDGPEDRNGCRNHDEIELIRHIVAGRRPSWLKTDTGMQGGLTRTSPFVICGDLNADPVDGSGRQSAILRLLAHTRIHHVTPSSTGAVSAGAVQQGVNLNHRGESEFDTADFSDGVVGNLRVDYCLPSREFSVVDSGVYWPAPTEPGAELVDCSDHRLVWVDLQLAD